MAGAECAGQYEFQCLHGMGEPLYEQVVGPGRQAGPAAVPHLRAGRHARNAARLPGAPAARERRQHVVRQPHRRCGDTARDADRRPGRRRRGARSARAPSVRRIRSIALPRDLYAPAAQQLDRRSISPTSIACARWREPSASARAEPSRRAGHCRASTHDVGGDARVAQSRRSPRHRRRRPRGRRTRRRRRARHRRACAAGLARRTPAARAAMLERAADATAGAASTA